MWKKILPFLIIFTIVIFLYYPVLGTFFSQDDFFHFKVSQTDGSIFGLLKLLGFYPFEERGIAFYRPISREIPFNIYYSIFGLNHLPFRIFSFLIHFINIALVYILIQRMFKKRILSFFVSFFFGITAANVATLYYLAGGLQTLLATTFTLTSLILFQKYLAERKLLFYLLTFFSFILAISSHEQAAITPFLLLGLIFIFNSNSGIKENLTALLPHFIVVSFLLYIEFFIIGFSSEEQQYQAVFNLKTILNSLFWYTNWAIGIPETLIDFVYPGFKLNPTLLRYWSNYYQIIFPSFFTSLGLMLFAAIYLVFKKRSVFINKKFFFLIVWYLFGLLPVLLLPLHKSTHYLTISLPAFWTMVGLVMFGFYNEFKKSFNNLSKVIFALFILGLIILSTTSAFLGSTNYWAATRGKLAEKLIKEVTNTYPNLPKGAIIYFKNDTNYPVLTKEWGNSSGQAKVILNGSDALRLLYNDPTIKVFYEDFGAVPEEFSKEQIYNIIVKLI